MSLRAKLLFGYLVFIVGLAVLGGWSAWHLHGMGDVSRRIIANNTVPFSIGALLARLRVAQSGHPPPVTARKLGPGHTEASHYLQVYMGQLQYKLEAVPARPRSL